MSRLWTDLHAGTRILFWGGLHQLRAQFSRFHHRFCYHVFLYAYKGCDYIDRYGHCAGGADRSYQLQILEVRLGQYLHQVSAGKDRSYILNRPEIGARLRSFVEEQIQNAQVGQKTVLWTEYLWICRKTQLIIP